MSYNTRNYRAVGGSTWVVSGDLNVPSTGTINIETGGKVIVESGGEMEIESGGEVSVESGGIIDFESGGYHTLALTSHTSDLSPLIIGAMNEVDPSSGITVILPDPAAGAECWILPTANAATTGRLSICANAITSDADHVIGTATGTSPFQNLITFVWSTGAGMLGFKAVNSSQWVLVHDVVSVSFGSSAANTTA